MASRNLTGTLKYADGTAAASQTVSFYLSDAPGLAADAAILAAVRTTTTTTSGGFNVALETGTTTFEYRVRLPDDMIYVFDFATGTTVALHDLTFK